MVVGGHSTSLASRSRCSGWILRRSRVWTTRPHHKSQPWPTDPSCGGPHPRSNLIRNRQTPPGNSHPNASTSRHMPLVGDREDLASPVEMARLERWWLRYVQGLLRTFGPCLTGGAGTSEQPCVLLRDWILPPSLVPGARCRTPFLSSDRSRSRSLPARSERDGWPGHGVTLPADYRISGGSSPM